MTTGCKCEEIKCRLPRLRFIDCVLPVDWIRFQSILPFRILQKVEFFLRQDDFDSKGGFQKEGIRGRKFKFSIGLRCC